MKKLILLFAAACPLMLQAYDMTVPVVLKKFQTAPPAGARLQDPVWNDVPELSGFFKLGAPQAAEFRSIVQTAYDNEALYVRLIGFDPEYFHRDSNPSYLLDNCGEIFLIPNPDDPLKYFHSILDLTGSVQHSRLGQTDIPANQYRAACISGNQDYFIIEWKIPFLLFGKLPTAGEKWLFSVARVAKNRKGKELSALTELKRPTFHDTACFTTIVFPEEVSSKQLAEQLAGERRARIRALREKAGAQISYLSAHREELKSFGMNRTWEELEEDFRKSELPGISDYAALKILSPLYEHLLVLRCQYEFAVLTMQEK